MTYLLDSAVCVSVTRRRSDAVVRRLLAASPADLAISTVTLLELEVGVFRSQHPERERQRVDQLLLVLPRLIPFDVEAARVCARVRHLTRFQPIGILDAQIAATALVHDLTVVTNNVREFARVPGLRVEDWSRAE